MTENANVDLSHKEPPHPGGILERAYMRNRKIDAKVLSARSGLDRDRLDQLIGGEADFTDDDINKLGRVFKRAATLKKLQANYDFFKANGRRMTQEEMKTAFKPGESFPS